MIKVEDVYKIGKFNRPHGINGELLFTFTDDIFDRVDCDFFICDMDGILVPFYIEEYRFRSDMTALVKLEDVDSEEKAKMFTNVEVFFPKKYVDKLSDDEVLSWNYLVGFSVEDVKYGILGMVVDYDDSTMNVLLKIDNAGKELLLPAHEDFIMEVDKENKKLIVQIPEGLLE
ncbi:MAG: ribosome maturation factor RimM [Phocaeicola sp.]|uniref:ribosome maturation factor RimM n=1 Tax=Phocaeicola TaxID=909656 RepID=UPI00234F356A|nr:ribosome maturation factor RimM [Phocaeicola oris]MCE2615961.1 ribosome maturation factor RimM [Phocaeicola oris]